MHVEGSNSKIYSDYFGYILIVLVELNIDVSVVPLDDLIRYNVDFLSWLLWPFWFNISCFLLHFGNEISNIIANSRFSNSSRRITFIVVLSPRSSISLYPLIVCIDSEIWLYPLDSFAGSFIHDLRSSVIFQFWTGGLMPYVNSIQATNRNISSFSHIWWLLEQF